MGIDIDNDSLLENLLLTVIKLIEQQLAISDDILNICWKYEMDKNPNEKENRLWNVLKNTIEYVLSNSKNKRIWIWFKSCIFSSVIWYELVSFAQSNSIGDSESGVKKGDASNDLNDFKLICCCGASMEVNAVKNLYANYDGNCSKCNIRIGASNYCYHCPKGKSKYHPRKKFFDLCASCGEKYAQEVGHVQRLQENENVSLANKNVNNIDKSSNGSILFNSLYGMADDRLLKQKEEFQKIIDNLSSQESWKNMTSFPQNRKNMVDTQVNGASLRQDSKECLTFPNELGFSMEKLNDLNLKDFYDSC